MILLSLSTLILSFLIHLLHRKFHIFEDYIHLNGHHGSENQLLLNVLLIAPIITFIMTLIATKTKKSYIPLLMMFTLTLSSISIIAGGNGLVEYHFSIFMVIAMLAYYESIKLIMISTIIFAVHHIGGHFLNPEMISGTSDYPFNLLAIHAIFLILTSSATILQIFYKTKLTREFEKDIKVRQAQLDNVLSKLKDTSETVISKTNTLLDHVQKSKTNSKRVSIVIEEIANGSQKQAAATEESKTAINEMAIGTQRIAENSTVVAEQSHSSVNEVKKGISAIEDTTKQMDNIQHSVLSLAKTIEKLDQRSKDIKTILKVITDITEQTNLLALNAAIEAARAGEHGKGFAVVAEEVRKLADQSNLSAAEINTIINEIENGISDAKLAMQQGKQEVINGIDSVVATGKILNNISAIANEVNAQIQEISAVTQQLSASTEEVAVTVDDMNTIAQNAKDSTTHVASYTDEQLNSIEEVQVISETLQQMSHELEGLVNKFTSRNAQATLSSDK